MGEKRFPTPVLWEQTFSDSMVLRTVSLVSIPRDTLPTPCPWLLAPSLLHYYLNFHVSPPDNKSLKGTRHLLYFFASPYPSHCYECSAIHLRCLGGELCLTGVLSFMGSQVLTSPKHALIFDLWPICQLCSKSHLEMNRKTRNDFNCTCQHRFQHVDEGCQHEVTLSRWVVSAYLSSRSGCTPLHSKNDDTLTHHMRLPSQ